MSIVFVVHYDRDLSGDSVFARCKLPPSREDLASQRSPHLSGL